MHKSDIIAALDAFVHQRPGLEFGNYGDIRTYRAELRSIARDLHHARQLLAYVARRDSITADRIIDAARSGRLSILVTDTGTVTLDYCVGQYWPTEYRRAVCAVLASAIWAYWRDDCAPSPRPESVGAQPVAHARRELGRAIASRFFN